MGSYRAIILMWLLNAKCITSRSVPENLQAFYNSARDSGPCSGQDLLQGGFYNAEGGSADYAYCQRGVAGMAIYLKGPDTKLANMDVDCDGQQTDLDARCEASTDTQARTSFQSEVQQYGISDLKADIHPYVVLGNEGAYSPTFNPQQAGVLPLSLVAVVCGDQLIYAVWGDVNGDDGPPLVGEASLAVATACYGSDVGGNNGHDEEDVLYIAFTGSDAVPGDIARWNASNYEEFESSITTFGDALVAKLSGSTTATPSVAPSFVRGFDVVLVVSMLMSLGFVWVYHTV